MKRATITAAIAGLGILLASTTGVIAHGRYRWRPVHEHGDGFWEWPGNVLEYAGRFLGEVNPTHFRGPWCAAFVNMVLGATGHRHVASLRAIDAIRDGYRVRDPRPGDLAVMRGHVTFFVRRGGRGFIGLGGNQGHDRVTEISFPLTRVIAFVRVP